MVMSPMSFPKLWQTDQFVAGFFTDILYFLWNMKFVRTSSSVKWKDFLCSPWKSTLSILRVHEEMLRNLRRLSDHSSLVEGGKGEARRGGWGLLYPKRPTSWQFHMCYFIVLMCSLLFHNVENSTNIEALEYLGVSKLLTGTVYTLPH